jgi:hypothetical protein
MTIRRFVLVDFTYARDVMGHVHSYEAGTTYEMPRALAHAAAKRELVAAKRPVDWEPPSILRPPEVTEAELAAVESELKALQRLCLKSSIISSCSVPYYPISTPPSLGPRVFPELRQARLGS